MPPRPADATNPAPAAGGPAPRARRWGSDRARRAWRLVVVSVLLGAVTTVAVAWACAIGAARPRWEVFPLRLECARPWPCRVPADWPRPSWDSRAETFGALLRVRSGGDVPPRAPGERARVRSVRVSERMAGWPLLARRTRVLTEEDRHDPAPYAFAREIEQIPGVRVGRPGGLRPLPLTPILPGFAANTALAAAAWLALLALPPALRAHRRRRRGACPACGDDLHHLRTPRCPECGRPRAGG